MKNKFLLIIILGIFLINTPYTIGGMSYCCEKTNSGFWCQDVDKESECDTSVRASNPPTSCEATYYCKLGTCFDSQEGTCTGNTPQILVRRTGAPCNPPFHPQWESTRSRASSKIRL